MRLFYCPYLDEQVELSEERSSHIVERHPELATDLYQKISETLADPDQVVVSKRFQKARLFSRWFSDFQKGKYVVVIVVSENIPSKRNWIITTYVTHRLMEGDIEWKRN